jgi:hypothetical protein
MVNTAAHTIGGAILSGLFMLAVVVVLMLLGLMIPPEPEALEQLRDRARWWVP